MSRIPRWIAATFLGAALTVQVQAQDPAPEAPVSAEDVAEEAAQPASDLVTMLDADGRFTVLVGALQSTNLVETLQGEGPFTLFAPTDKAFAALPEGALDVLTPEQLQAVLLYHVVGDALDNEMSEAGSVEGSVLQFTATEDGWMVNEATVLEAGIEASNGTIHAIDTVLMPPPGEDEGDSDDSPGDGSDAESGPDDGP